MKMHSCFDCKFRKLPLKDTSCDKGVVEKGGLVLQCLGWQEKKSKDDRSKGYWIFQKANEEQTDGYECSVCHQTFHTKVPYFSEFNFCPNCGAKMQEGDESAIN